MMQSQVRRLARQIHARGELSWADAQRAASCEVGRCAEERGSPARKWRLSGGSKATRISRGSNSPRPSRAGSGAARTSEAKASAVAARVSAAQKRLSAARSVGRRSSPPRSIGRLTRRSRSGSSSGSGSASDYETGSEEDDNEKDESETSSSEEEQEDEQEDEQEEEEEEEDEEEEEEEGKDERNEPPARPSFAPPPPPPHRVSQVLRPTKGIVAHTPTAAESNRCNLTSLQVARIVVFIGRSILRAYQDWEPNEAALASLELAELAVSSPKAHKQNKIQKKAPRKKAAPHQDRLQINLDLTATGKWNLDLKGEDTSAPDEAYPTVSWVRGDKSDDWNIKRDAHESGRLADAVEWSIQDANYSGGALCRWLSRRLFGVDSDTLVRAYIANGENGMVLQVGSRSREREEALKVIVVAGDKGTQAEAIVGAETEIRVQRVFYARGLSVRVSSEIELYTVAAGAYRVDYSPDNDDRTLDFSTDDPFRLACVRMGMIHTVLTNWLRLREYPRPLIRKLSFGIARLLLRGATVGIQGDLHTSNLGIVVPPLGREFADESEDLEDAAEGDAPIFVAGVGRLVLIDFGFGELLAEAPGLPRLKDWIKFLADLFIDPDTGKFLAKPVGPRAAKDADEAREVFYDPRRDSDAKRAEREEKQEKWNNYANSVALQHEMLDRFIEIGLVPDNVAVYDKGSQRRRGHRINPADIIAELARIEAEEKRQSKEKEAQKKRAQKEDDGSSSDDEEEEEEEEEEED